MNQKKIKLEELLPLIEQELAAGGTFEIPITGTSMLPLLVQGRDSVVLTAVKGQLKKYDLPLYRRDDGAFVLHRVVEVGDGEYTMSGDNQQTLEKGVRHSQLIGVVSVIHRDGKTIDVNSAGYKLYCKLCRATMPFRVRIYSNKGKK